MTFTGLRNRIDINEAAMAQHPYQPHHLRHFTGALTDIRPQGAPPMVQAAEMNYWLAEGLKLDDPVLIEPVSQEVYAVKCQWDKRTCAEKWMAPDPEAKGVRVFSPVPVSTSPLLLTDRSIIEIR